MGLLRFTPSYILFLAYQVSTLELLANYKYWKSIGDMLLYDYSGSARHAGLYMGYIITDRGLAPNNHCFSSYMSYRYPGLDDYTFTFWLRNNPSSGEFIMGIYHYTVDVYIKYTFYNSYVNLLFQINGLIDNSKTATFPMFVGWNLHTLRVKVDSANRSILNIDFYLNLEPLHSTFLDTLTANVYINILQFANLEFTPALGLILYEMWIYTGFNNISELSSLVSTSSSCGCAYNCATSPSIICIPTYEKTLNKLGDSCSIECTNNSLSCRSDRSCILKNKAECQYGLYDIETYECLFYCPYNSCSCPGTMLDAFQPVTTFSCSCNLGYRKVYDHPPACVANSCLEYHIEGYRYICDSAESGYILDASGDCCICSLGFTQVSSSPVICVNTSICIGFSISGGDYTCSSCDVGYMIDFEGKCNECNTNYVNVLSNPFTCTLRVDNRVSYRLDSSNWICDRCDEGYVVDLYGRCNECPTGFSVISEVECVTLNCIAYNIVGGKYICTECLKGYQIDAEGTCSMCDDNYDMVSEEPLICAPQLDNCFIYEILQEEFICKECSMGYKLSNSGLCDECAQNYIRIESETVLCLQNIPNCLGYELNEESLVCMTCKEGYIRLPQNDPLCIKEAIHCSEYGLNENNWVCISCELGYEMNDLNECNQCAPGYIYSDSNCILPTESDTQN